MAQGKTITQLPLIVSADSSSSTIIVKDGVTSQIQYSALTVSPEVFQTTVDSKLGLTGGTVDGQVQIVSSTSSEIPGQSSQLLPTTGWTSNGWTGNFVTGFTHTTGNTTTLVSSYSATPATTYVLGYDIVPTNTTYDVYFGQNGEYLNTSLNVTNTVGCSSKKEVNPGFICYDGFQIKYLIVSGGKSGTQCINGNCPKGFKCEGGECVVDLDSGVWSEKYVGVDCTKVVASPCAYATHINIGCHTCCNARPIFQMCDGTQEILGYTNECATYGPSKSYIGPNGIFYTELLEDFIDSITFNDTFRGSINYGSSCDGNADCPPGYVCLDGYSVRQIITSSMISGVNCASNGYCPQGFVCNNGNCEPDLNSGLWIEIGQKPGGFPIYQGPGGVELHTGWDEGEEYALYDNPNSYEGEYRQTCSIDNDCPKGFVCVNGYCIKLIQTSDLYNGMSTKGVCGCPTGYKINPVYPYTATTSCFADLESGYWTNVGTSVNSANGNVTISFGGISATTNTSGTLGVYAKDYSPLRVSPSSNFDGLLMTYLRTVTGTTTSTFSLSDGNSTNVTQLRGSTSNLTNNFIGIDAGNQNVSGERNLSFGQNSLTSNVAGNKNLAIGVDSLKSVVGVDSNIAIGDSSLLTNAYGSNNVSIGVNSMMVDKDPNCSVSIGYNTLMNNSEIDENVAIGCSAGENSNTSNTVYVGARAGYYDTGSGSTFIGYSSGENNLGDLNTLLGEYSGNLNTSGDSLTFIGWSSGKENTTGNENTFIGSSSGLYNQDGSGNIAVGYMAGALTLDGVTENTSPNGSIYIGNNTKSFNVDDTNSIVIGNSAESQGNNTIVIGNTDNETIFLNGDLSVVGTDSTSFSVNDFGINSTGVVSLVTDSLSIQDSQGDGYNLTTTSGQNGQVLTYTNGNATWESPSGDGNVTGSGTLNYIPKWTGSTGLGNSLIYDNGTNVGIGTSSPSTKLDVIITGGTIGVRISGDSTSDMLRVTQTGSGNALIIEDEGNPDSTPFTVTSDGKVYIGTTDPTSSILNVGGNSHFYGNIFLNGTTNRAIQNSTPGRALINFATAGDSYFNNGNLGIGTISPGSKLDINASTGSTIGLRVSGGSSVDMVRITQTGSGNAIIVEDDENPDSTPFVVTSGGSVGIGIDSPLHGYKLHVRNGAATNSVGISGTMSVFESTGNTYVSILSPNANTSGIAFGTADIRSASYLRWSYTNNQMSLSTNRTGATLSFSTDNEQQRMLITSGGSVGIGTSSPSQTLTINGNSLLQGVLFVGDDLNPGGIVNGRFNRPLSGLTTLTSVFHAPTVYSGVNIVYGIRSQTILGSSVSLTNYSHFSVADGNVEVGSTISQNISYSVGSDFTKGSTNIGFYGGITSSTNNWNIYMIGNAPNYISGDLRIGSSLNTGSKLYVSASTNPVRFEGLQTNTGATKTVIADNNGVLYTETKPKKYVALLTQTGTSAPTAIVLENTLGSITFAYQTVGIYTVTATGLLTTSKTTIVTGGAVCSVSSQTTNGFFLISYGIPTPTNGILNNSTLEITVYP
jgi:trimeric autotransporter adhesin